MKRSNLEEMRPLGKATARCARKAIGSRTRTSPRVKAMGFGPAHTSTRAASQARPATVSSRPMALSGRRAHPKRPATTNSTPTPRS